MILLAMALFFGALQALRSKEKIGNYHREWVADTPFDIWYEGE